MFKRNKAFVLLIAIVVAVLFAAGILYGESALAFYNELLAYSKQYMDRLNEAPLWVYPLLLAVLPVFMLPVSPILVLAGSRPEPLWVVILACMLGHTLSITISYFIGVKFGKILGAFLEKRGYKMLKASSEHESELIVITRLIPGNPLAVQNYLLGIARVSALKYFLYSLPIQYITLIAYIAFGDGILNGKFFPFATGISILVIVAVLAKIIVKKLEARKNGIS